MAVRATDTRGRGGDCYGTIGRTYDHPGYLAMEVRFGDGSVDLYWHHELKRSAKNRPGRRH